jgi:predicted PurR-regulated permease PerM
VSTTLAEKRPAAGWLGRQAPRPAEEERRSHLEVVSTRSQRRSRPRAVYAIVAIGMLLGIVVSQLLLSIAVSQGAYQLSSLATKQTQLQRSYQAASEDLNRLTSPQNLAANANALGMVSNSNPAYLRLSDAAVLGAAVPASGSAGTVTGGQGNLVPNALLTGVPLVTAPGTSAPAPPPASVPLDGALPTPVTH